MIMKRLRNTLMSLAMLLLLLVSVITPVAANGENGEPNGIPEPEPPPAGPQGSTYDGYEGQFLVIVCGSYAGYDWAEEWQRGTTLAETVSQVGTCYACSGTNYPCPGTNYKIEIPEGTVVEGYYPGQGRVICLEVKVVNGHLFFSPSLKLSQPATIYELVDGEWVEVMSFSQVLNGEAK